MANVVKRKDREWTVTRNDPVPVKKNRAARRAEAQAASSDPRVRRMIAATIPNAAPEDN